MVYFQLITDESKCLLEVECFENSLFLNVINIFLHQM